MDPEECLGLIESCLWESNWSEARDHIADLDDWIYLDGFVPHITLHVPLDCPEHIARRIFDMGREYGLKYRIGKEVEIS